MQKDIRESALQVLKTLNGDVSERQIIDILLGLIDDHEIRAEVTKALVRKPPVLKVEVKT